jgi:hypothetical protein
MHILKALSYHINDVLLYQMLMRHERAWLRASVVTVLIKNKNLSPDVPVNKVSLYKEHCLFWHAFLNDVATHPTLMQTSLLMLGGHPAI